MTDRELLPQSRLGVLRQLLQEPKPTKSTTTKKILWRVLGYVGYSKVGDHAATVPPVRKVV